MKQIVALGGGGFSTEPENPLLDQYILAQTRKTDPKICFVPTASGDSENYIERFYTSFKKLACIPSHLSLFNPSTKKIREFILGQDVIYVGGGNTKNLLAVWKDWGVDLVLREAWDQGIVLAGISAGSLCWFEEGVTDSFGDGLDAIRCLGFLKGSNCPHYDGELARRPSYHQLLSSGRLQGGIAVEDGVGVHFHDLAIHKVVSSKPDGKAYLAHYSKNQVVEHELKGEYLGAGRAFSAH